MAVEATQAANVSRAASVTAAIRKAAQLTGAKFGYLLATAKVESNLNPGAAAKTSSAGGLFQFIDQTWLGTLKEAGPLLGYGQYAEAIKRGPDGRYSVSDPAMRRQVLALRQDPTANALMAGVFTNSNARHLTNKLGRAPTDGELYIAHFMGANGAARLIGMAEANPGATAAHSFPSAARANRSIFFDKSGRARNFAEVARNLSGRYDVASARMRGVEGAEAVQGPASITATVQGPAFVAETARVARAYQVSDAASRVPAAKAAAPASGEPVFHNPYRSAGRRQPVAAVVAELWNGQARTSQQDAARRAAQELERRAPAQPQPQPQPAAAATQKAAVETLGLFQDLKPDVRSLFTAGVRG